MSTGAGGRGPAPPLDHHAEWHPSVNPWLIAGSVMLATFMEVLDTTIVAVSLPHIAGNLSATNEEATWVLTSYLVSNAIVLPASGWLALYFGRVRLLMGCVAIFTLSSFLCGIAPTMTFLVLARVLQGAGGGAMQPLAQAILLESFPPAKRGVAMAVFGIGVVVAPVIGPTLGGWLTDSYSWRWVFNINIPIGILALYLIRRNVEDPPYIKNAKPGRIDGIGFGLLTLWLATLQVVLDKGQLEDWFASQWICWFSIISVGAMAAFIYRELHTPEPICNLRVFLNRNFWIGTLVMTVFGSALYSTVTLMPLFLQTLVGYTSAKAGLVTSPRGLGSLFVMPLVGRLIAFMDARWMLVIGISIFVASTFMLGGLNTQIGMSNVVWPMVVQGVGLGFIFVPLSTLSVSTLAQRQMGNATGLYNLMRNLGGSIGISVATTYLARDAQAHQNMLVSHLTPYDPVFTQRIGAIAAGLAPYTGAPQAQMQAYAAVHGILMQQSMLRAFMDDFNWLALIVAVCIPGALVMKKVVHKKGPAAAAH
jgi:MFS transporter, DHA2 family, multidrug resistance protein